MPLTLAFDIYGTLINTDGVRKELQEIAGDEELTNRWLVLWRLKQLKYSFRRAAMSMHTDFSVVTTDTLLYCSNHFNRKLSDDEFRRLTDVYTRLAAFTDAITAIPVLKERGYPISAFSNGSHQAVTSLLNRTGITRFFEKIVSTEALPQFKPSRSVYRHFNETVGCEPHQTIIITGNSFDLIGDRHAGWKGAWVKRSDRAVFDP